MKKCRNNYLLLLLVGVLFLGIGYAAISNITLNINGSATANGTATNEDFKVRFVKFDSSDDNYVANASTNAAVVNATNGIDAANVSIDVTADDKAEFSISEGFDEVGDFVTLEYNVVNESEGLPAYIYVDVENESNTASDYFVITKTIEDNELGEGEITKVIVKVELIARPKLDIDASFEVKLTASDTVQEEIPVTPTYTAYQIGDVINYNPVDNTTCENPTSATGTKTGCMKWFVITTDDTTSKDTVDVILDHNTTAMVAYESSGTYKEYANASIKSTVDALVSSDGWKVTPRLITAEEIVAITENTKWINAKTQKFVFGSKSGTLYNYMNDEQKARHRSFTWLFEYTNCGNSGCSNTDNNTYGYWTSSHVSDDSTHAWVVASTGMLTTWVVSTDSTFGVRPVITLDKAIVD